MEPLRETVNLGLRHIRRAFISVSNKTKLSRLAQALDYYRVAIISTGGTAKALEDVGGMPTYVENVTGFPEMMDGRLKTLHPRVHGGLLAVRGNEEHEAAMKRYDIKPIDLLVVNFYPFEQTVSKFGVSIKNAIESIDIGGPAMVRSAAKNFNDVTVIVHPMQYAELIYELRSNNGSTSLQYRQKCMVEAFELIARYDQAIASYLAAKYNQGTLLPQS